MKSVFIMSLISAVLSLVAFIGFGAMTAVPHSAGRSFPFKTAVAIGLGGVVWMNIAAWAYRRERSAARKEIPRWLKSLLLVISALYSLGAVLLAFG